MLNQLFNFCKKEYILFFLLAFSFQYSFSQNITGTSTVQPNTAHTYYYSDGNIYSDLAWIVDGGTVTKTGVSGKQYFANVTWGNSNSGTITCSSGMFLLAGMSVVIESNAPEIPEPPAVTIYCNSTKLTRGTPPEGVIWYWQSFFDGTSMANSNEYIILDSGSNYYLRAYNEETGLWSNARSISYTISDEACNKSDENYIYNITPNEATSDLTTLNNSQKIENITYYDGLGRPIQSNSIRAGGDSENIVTHVGYDNLGRQSKSYLPYAAPNGGYGYKSDALSETNLFYNTSKYEYTQNPYTETLYDNSPLNLTTEVAAAGNAWKIDGIEDHSVKTEYKLLKTEDYVRNYIVTYTNGIPTLVDKGYFVSNASNEVNDINPILYKFITKNENWVASDLDDNTTQIFKDYKGRVVLSRTFNNQEPHDTYYVYDNYGNLIYVLPPKVNASDDIPNSVELASLCFQYKYDDKNRLIEKQIPGKEAEYIVYNTLNQPILIQDGNQRTSTQKNGRLLNTIRKVA